MAARLTYRRKHTYRTRSNHVRRFHTPGGRLAFQYTDKKTSPVVCGETHEPLNGLPVLTKQKWMRLSRKQRSVSRPYGGCLNGEVVRFRILRAFFNEEIKVIKNASSARKNKKGKAKKK